MYHRSVSSIRIVACAALILSLPVAACGDDEGGSGGGGAVTSQGGAGASDAGMGGVAGMGGEASGGSGGDSDLVVGRACVSASDCGIDPSARCLGPDDDVPVFGALRGSTTAGGPAGGYCSKDCVMHTDCPLDSVCMEINDTSGVCVLSCEYESPPFGGLNDPIPSSKCRGRTDSSCYLRALGDLCIPHCGSDADCGTRSCDLRTGLCVDTPHAGEAVGIGGCELDDPLTMADENLCAGPCVDLGGGNSVCSQHCGLGGDVGDHDCGGIDQGLCSFRPGSAGLGDGGFCTIACQAHDDCAFSENLFCDHIGAIDDGHCFPATACPNGNECDADELCTDTQVGMVCLQEDPVTAGMLRFPLGAAAP
jgi:hypothetical protein